MTASDVAPDLTVVVPLTDLRAMGLKGLAGWVLQDEAESRYQVAAVLPPDSSLNPPVRALLRPHDRIITGPGDSFAALLHAGATDARTPHLLLTEGHCLPDPGCVRAVRAAFAGGASALALRSKHLNLSRAAEAEQEIFDENLPAWRASGTTLAVRLRGFALDRELYLRSGGLDPTLGLFAEQAFGMALENLGVKVEPVDAAVVTHLNSDSLGYVRKGVASHAQGEATLASRIGLSAYESHFGHFTEPWEWLACERRILVAEARVLVDLIRRIAPSPRRAVLLRALLGRLSRLPLGKASLRLGSRLEVWLAVAGVHAVARNRPIRKPYERAWRAFARQERLRWVVGAEARGASSLTMDELVAPEALGFFAPEAVGGQVVRWSRSAASIFLARDEPFDLIHLECGPDGGSTDREVVFRVDGRPARVESRGREIKVRPVAGRFSPGRHRLTFAVEPRLRSAPFPTAAGLGLVRVETRVHDTVA